MSNARKRHCDNSINSTLKPLSTVFFIVMGLFWLYSLIYKIQSELSPGRADVPSSYREYKPSDHREDKRSEQEQSSHKEEERKKEGEEEGGYWQELRSYIYGFTLALILTGLAFGMVHWSLFQHFWMLIGIGALALLQIIVHFRFFLHIGFSEQKREDLQLVLFSTLILALMVGGTIWILHNLAARM